MKILALDLGKGKTVACVYESATGEHRFDKRATSPQTLHDLMVEVNPDRVVFEIGPSAGWVADLVRALGVEFQAANTAHHAWRWRNNKKKNDRMDALKLAQLSAMGQLPTVYVPARRVRQWRSLIAYRTTLVQRLTQIKNHIRAILDRQGSSMPAGRKGWSIESIDALKAMARPLEQVEIEDLWRGELGVELRAKEALEELIRQVETKLDGLAAADARVRRIRSIPGVGARLAEAVVSVLDDAKRFKSVRQVGSYVGLTPRQYQSGDSDRQGKISGQGHRLLRHLLVEVAWVGLRYNPWMREVYERVRRGSAARKKIAIVAVARRLLIRCWAMLRDGSDWRAESVGQTQALVAAGA